MASMTDQNRVAALMNWMFEGGSAPTITEPYHLRLMTAVGSNTSNGTEATSGNCPGYTAGGVTMGSPSFGANSSGTSASANSESWTATGAWTAIVGIEIWDTAATALRWLQGSVTSVTLANGNTLSFAAGAVTANASAW
jgi:hypothetical protein